MPPERAKCTFAEVVHTERGMKWSRHWAWLLPAWAAVVCLAQETGLSAGEIRAVLDDVLATEYCGTAVQNGLGVNTASRGLSPVPGRGFVCIEEADWGPVLLEMAEAELERCKTATADAVSEYRKAMEAFADGKGWKMTRDEQNRATEAAFGPRVAIQTESRKLHQMLALMMNMQEEHEAVLRMIERIAVESPVEFNIYRVANEAWLRQRLKDGDAERFLALAKEYRAKNGKGSAEEIDFCQRATESWLPACTAEKDYAMLARYVLEAMDGCGDYPQCSGFDRVATDHLRGWVGSVQRRRMAERFLDWQPFRRSHVNKETGVEEYEEPTPEAVVQLLRSRAAAELAADEKDLTDLREVYGAWEEEGDVAEPPEAGEMRAGPCDGAVPEGKTYRDYPEWKLLPKGPDMDDEACERAFQQLVAEGDAGHEALLAIVRECEDPMLATRALAVLRLSSGDKSKVREELKQILAERLSHASGPEEWLMTSIAEALVVIGNERDMDALAPMLAHPTRRVRIIGARCLGKRGGESAIAILENAKSQNPEKRVLEEIDTAIATIKSRLAENDSGRDPAP